MECDMTRCYILILTICWVMVNSLMGSQKPLSPNGLSEFEQVSPFRHSTYRKAKVSRVPSFDKPSSGQPSAVVSSRQLVPISPFGSGPMRKKQVSRVPTFGISSPNCSAFEPTQQLEDVEAELIQKLEEIKDLIVTMGVHGIKSEIKLDDIICWIKKSDEPLVEADKISRDQLARIETFAKFKYEELKALLDQGGFEDELLELDGLNKTSGPVLFLEQLRAASPSIYQKTSDKLECKRLESLLYEAASNGVITFEDFSDAISTLEAIEHTEEKRLFLKTSCRELLRQKYRTPSPVHFSPDLEETLLYSASPLEMLEMHGNDNKWYDDKLSRGPSPEDLREGRDSAV